MAEEQIEFDASPIHRLRRAGTGHEGGESYEAGIDFPEAEDADENTQTGSAPSRGFDDADDVRRIIVIAALRAAATPAERRRVMRERTPSAVVIRVPSPSWNEPVADYLKSLRRDWRIVTRDGRLRSENNPAYQNETVGNALTANRSFFGIAVDPTNQLPASLVAGADVSLEVRSPAARTVSDILEACFPGSAPTITEGDVAGLEIEDMVCAIGPAPTAEQAIEHMRRAASRRSAGDTVGDIPDLAEAVEYGEAQQIALGLAQDLIDFKKGKLSWADAAKGALFTGPPGTGKSLLAASVAQAAAVPLIKLSIGELFSRRDGHLGDCIKNMNEVFAKARALAPAVLLCDELEAMPHRGRLGRNGDFWLPLIDMFLIATDAGLHSGHSGGHSAGRGAGVVIIGTTNHGDMIDPALIRPNRFERVCEVLPPDADGAVRIVRHHLRSDLPDADLTDVGRMTAGRTAAEIMQVVRSARQIARTAGRAMDLRDLADAAGGDEERFPALERRLAVHEAGHAVVAVVTGSARLLHVTLHARGVSGGRVAMQENDEDLPTLDSTEKQVVRMLAGDAAERVLIGAASIGSGGPADQSDIGRASTALAVIHAATTVSGNLLHRAEPENALAIVRADPVLRARVEKHLQDLHHRALDLVERNRDRIEAVAEALQRTRYLDAAAVVEIVSSLPQNDERGDHPPRPAFKLRDVSSD